MESGPAVCCQDPRAELVDRVAAISVAHLEETDEGPEPARNGVDPPPRARAASVIPGTASRPTPVRPSLSARKFSLQERAAGSCLGSQVGPYSTGPASHISPRAWRRPTIESHHVAISDTEVGGVDLEVVCGPVRKGWIFTHHMYRILSFLWFTYF